MTSKLVLEAFEIPRTLRKWGADRLFSLGDTSVPRCEVPHLLFVQQAYLAYAPEEWGFQVPRRLRVRMALMAGYFRAGLPGVSAFLVQTEDMRQRLASRWNIRPERIHRVPSPLDGEVWESLARADPLPPRDPPYICYVAGPGPHKNHQVLAGVMAALATRHPALRCVLTVAAGTVPRLVEAARELGILDRFVFSGELARSDLPGLLAGATAMVMPSKLESFGLPYYEALAAGCPVVAADRAFAREALGETGYYAPADDPEAFAAHVSMILDSADLRAEAARRCLARWLSTRSTRQEVAATYLRILENLE
jgi:glycosyltransferase involved in cell wall biosynthesis